MACGRWGSLPCHSMPSCWDDLPPPKYQARLVAQVRPPAVQPGRFHWQPALFPACCPPVREFCGRLRSPACLSDEMGGRGLPEWVVSFSACKGGKVAHPRQLECVHHFDDRSKRCFSI